MRRPSIVLHRVQRAVSDVTVEHPRHPGAHLLHARVRAVALDTRNCPTVAVSGPSAHCRQLAVAEACQVLPAARSEGLTFLGRVDLGHANGDVHLSVGRISARGQRVAISDANDGAGEQGGKYRHAAS